MPYIYISTVNTYLTRSYCFITANSLSSHNTDLQWICLSVSVGSMLVSVHLHLYIRLKSRSSGLWCGRIPTFRRSSLHPFSLQSDDGGSMVLRNVDILPQHYTASQPRRTRLESLSKPHSLHPEDGGNMVLRNVDILPQHYTASTQKIGTWIYIQALFTSPWRWRQHGTPKRWYPTTALHGVKTQKVSTWIFTAVKTSNLSFVFIQGSIINVYPSTFSFQTPCNDTMKLI
jgi:hypothetical protein